MTIWGFFEEGSIEWPSWPFVPPGSSGHRGESAMLACFADDPLKAAEQTLVFKRDFKLAEELPDALEVEAGLLEHYAAHVFDVLGPTCQDFCDDEILGAEHWDANAADIDEPPAREELHMQARPCNHHIDGHG